MRSWNSRNIFTQSFARFAPSDPVQSVTPTCGDGHALVIARMSARSLGGASRSALWLQIKADVLDLPVTVTECQEATSLGAAILGAVACGDFPDIAQAVARMVKVAARIEPGNKRDIETYEKSFKEYQKLNRLLLPGFGGKI